MYIKNIYMKQKKFNSSIFFALLFSLLLNVNCAATSIYQTAEISDEKRLTTTMGVSFVPYRNNQKNVDTITNLLFAPFQSISVQAMTRIMILPSLWDFGLKLGVGDPSIAAGIDTKLQIINTNGAAVALDIGYMLSEDLFNGEFNDFFAMTIFTFKVGDSFRPTIAPKYLYRVYNDLSIVKSYYGAYTAFTFNLGNSEIHPGIEALTTGNGGYILEVGLGASMKF